MLNIPAERHLGTQHFRHHFDGSHLSHPDLRAIVGEFERLAQGMIDSLTDSPELTAGLRKLREAKDCMILARVSELRQSGPVQPNAADPALIREQLAP